MDIKSAAVEMRRHPSINRKAFTLVPADLKLVKAEFTKLTKGGDDACSSGRGRGGRGQGGQPAASDAEAAQEAARMQLLTAALAVHAFSQFVFDSS